MTLVDFPFPVGTGGFSHETTTVCFVGNGRRGVADGRRFGLGRPVLRPAAEPLPRALLCALLRALLHGAVGL